MEKSYLKLDWSRVTEKLSGFAQTHAARKTLFEITPNLNKEQISQEWEIMSPLLQLAKQGYRAPIGEIEDLEALLKAIRVGQILNGEQLRLVMELLRASKQTYGFCTDFSDRCFPLRQFRTQIYPLPKLMQAIEMAIAPDGSILDDASPQLSSLRRAKLQIRKKIENQLRQIMVDPEVETYLQDKFFTVRSDRYVIPIRIDGRGRVKGFIYDTSDSGQTLFMEPVAIAEQNGELLETELSERIEILRIFRDLSEKTHENLDVLRNNYESLVSLDIFSAKVAYAVDLDADSVQLSDEPCLELYTARHPLIQSKNHSKVVANDIQLKPHQKCLVISGPNAGGKTVVLKTVGLLHLMLRAGLFVPSDRRSKMFPFERVLVEMGDAQSIENNLSTFSGHLMGLKPIVDSASKIDLVLLDEIAVGTEPQTGSALAQAILERLTAQSCISVVTTHFDNLKSLAVSHRDFRNASMEFSVRDLKPTYKLLMDVPGQSYGLEVAEQIGFPADLLRRAKKLRGNAATALDEAVSQLMAAREETLNLQKELADSKLAADEAEARWQHEKIALEETRKKAAQKLNQRFESQISDHREQSESLIHEMKSLLKKLQDAGADIVDDLKADFNSLKSKFSDTLDKSKQSLQEISAPYATQASLPGSLATFEDLKIGTEVYVISLSKTAVVSKLASSKEDKIEVTAGIVKLRTHLDDLRVLKQDAERISESSKMNTAKKSSSRPVINSRGIVAAKNLETELVLQGSTNTIDLRGLDKDQALQKLWLGLDKAILRGEHAMIVIHGHGTDALKAAVRSQLQTQSPYSIRFRPGRNEEGGDGVTIVFFEA